MRDVYAASESVTARTTSPGLETGGSTTTSTMRTLSRGRDDAKSTLPNGSGSYYRPTNYRAWFYSGSALNYDYKASTGIVLPRRYYGQSPWSQYSLGLNTSRLYGLDASNRPAVPGWLISTVESRLLAGTSTGNWDLGQFLAEFNETAGFIVSCVEDIARLIRAARAARARAPGGAVDSAYQAIKAYRDRLRRLSEEARRDKIKPVQPSGGDARAAQRASRARAARRRMRDSVRRAKAAELRARTNRALRRLNQAKGASNAYLAYLYGVLPLISDIYGALRTIDQGVSALKEKSFTVHASQEEPIPPPPTYTGVNDQGSQFKGKWSVRAKVTIKVNHPSLATLDDMGLLNPMSLAWELLPLSFVVDWLVPVGSFLRALGGYWGLALDSGYRTEYAEWNAKLRWTLGDRFVSGTPASVSGRLKAMNRLQYLSLPIPVPYLRGLDISTLDGIEKAITAVALGIQRR